MKKETISIKNIDLSDRTYIFTFEPIISQMVRSVREIGLINPPILEQISDQSAYRIVSGLKRILALKHLKMETTDAFIFTSNNNKPRLDLFLLNFYENISIRGLNLIEKSIFLNKLILKYNVSHATIINDYLKLIEHGSNEKVLDILLPLIKLEDNLKCAVVEDFLSADFAVALLKYSHDDREAIYEFYSQLKLGKNRQKEFLRLLDDIAHIQERSIYDIINDPVIVSILNDEILTVSQKVSRIRDVLRKMRFPEFVKADETFSEIKKQLKLPPSVILRPPPYFENDKFSIEVVFRNQTEFDNALKILNTISYNKSLNQLDSLIK